MIALKIITIVLQLIIAGMLGFTIGACISLNKKYNTIVNLLIDTTTHCKDMIDKSKEIINLNNQLMTFNKLSINKIDNDVNFIKENMVRRKNPIKD